MLFERGILANINHVLDTELAERARPTSSASRPWS